MILVYLFIQSGQQVLEGRGVVKIDTWKTFLGRGNCMVRGVRSPSTGTTRQANCSHPLGVVEIPQPLIQSSCHFQQICSFHFSCHWQTKGFNLEQTQCQPPQLLSELSIHNTTISIDIIQYIQVHTSSKLTTHRVGSLVKKRLLYSNFWEDCKIKAIVEELRSLQHPAAN